MINKFQQGGQVMKFVQSLAQTLQADPKQIIQIAKQYPEVLKSAIQTYQETQDMTKAAQAFQQAAQTLQQQQTQTMKHGAKLQYIKSLKHQCADDEELVYYKKGGSVDCGCQKKEKGGEVVTAKSGSAVEKFKEVRKGKFGVAAFADATGSQGGFRNAQKKKEEKKPKSGTWGATTQYIPGKNISRGSGNDTSEQEKKDKSAKDYYEGKGYHKHEKGGEVKKDCGGSSIVKKFKSARCGAKVKKHQYGAPLNISANDIYGGWNLIKNAGSRLWDLMNRNITNNPNIITGEPNFLPGRGAGNIGKVVGEIKKLPSNARGAIRMYKGKPTNILQKKVDWAKDADMRKSMDLGYNNKLAGRIDYSE